MVNKYSIILGLRSLFRNKVFTKRIIQLIFKPAEIVRNLEFTAVIKNLKPRSNDKILDIGSPKIISYYLTHKYPVFVIATDISNYFIKEYSSIIRNDERLHFKVEDARNLSFPDNYFDYIISISVIEHIPENGDSLAMSEIQRVLKPGGTAHITVPIRSKYNEQYKNSKAFYWSNLYKSNDKIFYQRQYDKKELFRRIIASSEMELYLIQFFYLKSIFRFIPNLPKIIRNLITPLNFFLSKLIFDKKLEYDANLKLDFCYMIFLKK